NISITQDAGSTLIGTGAVSTGINAVNNGATGGINITVNGVIDPPDVGVFSFIGNGSGTTNISVGGSITANDNGIAALTGGSGAINITTANGSAVFQGVNNAGQNNNIPFARAGILAFGTTGNVSINAGGAVSAKSDAIVASTSTS